MFPTTPTQIPIVPGLLPGTVKGTDVYPAVDVTDLTQSPQGSTKAYTIAQLYTFIISSLGLPIYPPTLAASIANLIAIYVNGISGIGATLTNSGTLAPFTLDGQAGILNGLYLIKNQSNAAQNGLYILTTVGTITSPWILTRYSGFNSASNIIDDAIVFILIGTQAETVWQLSFTGMVVVGTTLFDWNAFSLTPFLGFTWNTVSGTSDNLVANNGYINTNSSLTTFILPATANVGDSFEIKGYGSGGWKVVQNVLQQIILGIDSSTVGITGYIASTNQYDDIEITCIVANTIFKAGPPQGIITVN